VLRKSQGAKPAEDAAGGLPSEKDPDDTTAGQRGAMKSKGTEKRIQKNRGGPPMQLNQGSIIHGADDQKEGTPVERAKRGER